MSAAAEFAWMPHDSKTELRPVFEHAPIGFALYRREGNVTALNPAFEQMLGQGSGTAGSIPFADMMNSADRAEAERLFGELFERQRNSFQMDLQTSGANNGARRWTVWRVGGTNGDPDYALTLAEDAPLNREEDQHFRQAERLETVGRLAGGVAHDFNNLLTGVLLYCDLLMATLAPGDRGRKYAEEIRNAGMQASGLVRQLLSVARPETSEPRLLSLNEIVESMRNLLVHLIGENIELHFDLDSRRNRSKFC
jgi:two-component system cell cycle sensor histidine kinase/response regulator CckA